MAPKKMNMVAVVPGHEHASTAHRIAQWIVGERFPVGACLPVEKKLCQELGVSRTAVREALKTLASKGMLEGAPNLGCRVLPESLWNTFDPQVLLWRLKYRGGVAATEALTELRLLLEPAAARFAATSASYDEKRAIRNAYLQMIATEGTFGDFGEANIHFHKLILCASHNSFIAGSAPLVEVLVRSVEDLYAQAKWDLERVKIVFLPLLGCLSSAISEGNGDLADATARLIIVTARDDLLKGCTLEE